MKIIVRNKRASFDYFLEDKIEVGIVLLGTEIKSLRSHKVSLTEAYAIIDERGEAWIYRLAIPPYEFGNIHNHEMNRKRKLLMHKKEISRYAHRLKAENLTFIPCSLYWKKGRIKLEMALGKGKKKHDKREFETKKEIAKKLRQGQSEEL